MYDHDVCDSMDYFISNWILSLDILLTFLVGHTILQWFKKENFYVVRDYHALITLKYPVITEIGSVK